MNVADAERQLRQGMTIADWHGGTFLIREIRHKVEAPSVLKCWELDRYGQYQRTRFLPTSAVSHIVNAPAD